MQVDIRFDPGLKALGCQPVDITSSFKVLVSDMSTCTPTARAARAAWLRRGNAPYGRGAQFSIPSCELTTRITISIGRWTFLNGFLTKCRENRQLGENTGSPTVRMIISPDDFITAGCPTFFANYLNYCSLRNYYHIDLIDLVGGPSPTGPLAKTLR